MERIKAAIDAIVQERKHLVTEYVFFRRLALKLAIVRRDEIKTMAVDGKHLFYCESFVDSLTGKQLKGVVAHEVMHCAMLHFARRNNCDPVLWNMACDYAIHSRNFLAQFEMPENILIDHRFDGKSAESIYRILERERDEGDDGTGDSSEGDSSEGDDGTGDSSEGDDGTGDNGNFGIGGVLDAAETDESEVDLEQQWRVATEQAMIAERKAGNVPGYLLPVITAKEESRVDWKVVLSQFINDKSVREYSFTSPNRRFIGQDYILPGLIADGISKLVVLLDTSGSIYCSRVVNAFENEISDAFEFGISEIVVLYVDTDVRHEQTFYNGDEVKLDIRGGGGTNFATAMQYLDNHADAVAAVFLTDMETRSYGCEPSMPILWCNYGREGLEAPFGETVLIDRLD